MNLFLRRTRLQAGLTQEKLANALGTTPISIWRWESEKNIPSKYYQTVICAYFRLSPAAFGWSKTHTQVRMTNLFHFGTNHTSMNHAASAQEAKRRDMAT
ncbi:MAG: helix-turn-helix domain-containing protein [Ktedonobacteraceae bacterium]